MLFSKTASNIQLNMELVTQCSLCACGSNESGQRLNTSTMHKPSCKTDVRWSVEEARAFVSGVAGETSVVNFDPGMARVLGDVG